jgi:hypothetical protein
MSKKRKAKKRAAKRRLPIIEQASDLTLRDLVEGVNVPPPCYAGITDDDGSEILRNVRDSLNRQIRVSCEIPRAHGNG